MLNLDTHILVAVLTGDLSPAERTAIVREEWAISDIVLWELAKLVQLRRLTLDMNSPDFQACLKHLTIFPITPEIARASCRLDFTSDPADEIIAATSVVENIPLLTRDRRIRKSKMVRFAV